MGEVNDKGYWVGFDLGGTKMMAKVFDAEYTPLARCRCRTRAQEGVQAGVRRMVGLIREALREAGVSVKKLRGVGIGSPGPLDLNRGVLLDLPNMGWKDVGLRRQIEAAFHCPVTLLNDVDAGTYGEYRFGAGRGGRCVLGVFPGTGIGGSCVYEGRILRGKVHSCMEIGHCQVVPNGALCGCGRSGCLETVASRLAISSACAAAAYRGQAPHLLKLCGMDVAEIRSGSLAEAIAKGDRVVETIVREAARWTGVAVGNGVNLLAPDVVVLGGGLVEALPELYCEEVRNGARQSAMSDLAGSFKVRIAELGDEAVALGAAAWACESQGRG